MRRLRRRPAAVEPATPVLARPTPVAPAPTPARATASLAELTAEARYARDRLTLARRRAVLGRGMPSRVAELERLTASANARLRRARSAEPGEAVTTTTPDRNEP